MTHCVVAEVEDEDGTSSAAEGESRRPSATRRVAAAGVMQAASASRMQAAALSKPLDFQASTDHIISSSSSSHHTQITQEGLERRLCIQGGSRKNIGGLPLIIWEATTAKRNYYAL